MGALSGSDFLQALGWAVLNSLWQMAFLWVTYQILSGVVVKKPADRTLLATSLLTAGSGWFFYSLFSLLRFDQSSPVPGLTPLVVDEGINEWFYAALPIASIVYLAFLIVPILNFVRSYRYVRIIRTQGLQRAGAEWRLFVTKVRDRMGIRKDVQVWLSEFVSSPVTVGYLKPIILLPVAALSQLTTAQTEAILLHELSHIRRYDYLINLTVKFIQTVLYFNPFVNAFARIIETEREKTCDNMVLQFQYEPHGYASALLALEKEARQLQVLTIPAFSGRKSALMSRVEAIMGINRHERFSFARMLRTTAGIGCCITFLLVVMLSHPVQVKTSSGKLTGYFSPFLVYSSSENAGLEINAGIGTGDLASEAVPPLEDDIATTVDDRPVELEAVEPSGEDHAMFASFEPGSVEDQETLTGEQLEQVRLAVSTSRKVLEEIKWKDMEKGIADAMTMAQKEIAKQAFQQKAEQQNWGPMEDRLKLAYEKIDWTEINKNLSNAIIQIKYDSLQHVYNMALNSLGELQNQLDKTDIKAIPDTDITLNAVKEKQRELQIAREKIRKAKTKKIIQL